ncbi:MAG: TraB/GumN family protein [Bacteroidales bacterium]|nr:TraB/GumN family protein [Bacteroidales bacterium]MCF8391386.1 TraB/GumN family protein [Bacteroidales bacterium]
MNKKLHSLQLIILILISFSSNVFSQSEGPKTVFWEISGNGLEQSSYLFGTIHIMPKSDFEAFKTADNILVNCDQIVFEMSLDVPLKQKIEWAKEFILPAGQSIKDFMPEEDYLRLRSYSIDSLNIKESRFDKYIRFKPLAFYSALIPHVIGKKIEGYEMHFTKIAKKKGLPVAELESFEIQMAIFDSIPNTKQMEMFFSGDLNLHKEMADLLELYKSQDIYEMVSLMDEEESEYKAFENELLTQRNKNWVLKLDDLMREKSSFIAVGAGHLAGDSGLILLLREMGYEVEGICLIPECENQLTNQN